MGILSKLLSKKGIKSADELTPEERVTFDNYEKILSKENLSIEDIKKFLQNQIGSIETKWRGDMHREMKADLIPYHTCYKTLLEAIDAPLREKETLEKYLNSII